MTNKTEVVAKKHRMEKLRKICESCRQCSLYETRNRLVFGDGSCDAKIMFIGEAPGRNEDFKGLPFVGRSGQLLRRMIAAIGVKSEDYYIANILKDRPPENRTPTREEIDSCIKFLDKQIEIIRPKILVLLGRTAAGAMLPVFIESNMSELRQMTKERDFRLGGEQETEEGIRMVVTYHPSALLRNPSWKAGAAEDFRFIENLYKKL